MTLLSRRVKLIWAQSQVFSPICARCCGLCVAAAAPAVAVALVAQFGCIACLKHSLDIEMANPPRAGRRRRHKANWVRYFVMLSSRCNCSLCYWFCWEHGTQNFWRAGFRCNRVVVGKPKIMVCDTYSTGCQSCWCVLTWMNVGNSRLEKKNRSCWFSVIWGLWRTGNWYLTKYPAPH